MAYFRIMVVFASTLQFVAAFIIMVSGLSREEATPTCGSFLWGLCAVVSLMGIQRGPRHRRTRQAAISLNTILLLILAAMVVLTLGGGDAHAQLSRASAIMLALMTSLGITCAINIAGLIGIGRSPLADTPPLIVPRSRRSRILRITGAVFAGLILTIGLSIVTAEFMDRSEQKRHKVGARPVPSAGELYTFDNLNFSFASPGHPWVSMRPEAINADACFVLSKAPQTFFMIIAETTSPGIMTTESLAEIAIANMRSRAASEQHVRVAENIPHTIDDLSWRRIVTDAMLVGQDLTLVHWICEHNGFAYQLLTWGQQSRRESTIQEADLMRSCFTLVDPSRLATVSGDVATIDTSERYGYTVDLSGLNWHHLEDFRSTNPAADYLATSGVAYLSVVPASLLGQEPHGDALARGLLALNNFEFPGPEILSYKPYSSSGIAGYDISARRIHEQQSYDFRIRTLRGRNTAYLVAAWQPSSLNTSTLEDVISRVQIVPDAEAPPRDSFTDNERNYHATFINTVGLHAFSRKQYRRAIDHFRIASELDPSEPVYFLNIADALEHLSEYRDALDHLLALLPLFPELPGILARAAPLHAHLGDAAAAVALYEQLFADDYEDQAALSHWISLLVESDDLDRARSVLEQHIRPATSRHRVLSALLLQKSGDNEAAIELLQPAVEQFPIDAAAAEALFDLLYDLDRYREAIDIVDRLLTGGHDTSDNYFRRGIAELGLEWYPRAKASFLLALELDPGDPTIREHLTYTTSRLGQGDTTAIRTPIDAVPIDAELLAHDPTPPPHGGSGAFYDYRLTAIAHTPGQRVRSTEYLRIRIVDRRGLDHLSTIQFPLNPLGERLFVNSVIVYDEEHRAIWQGETSNYYILDDVSSDIATSNKTLHIPIASLAPGRTVELVVTREDLRPSEVFRFKDFVFASGFAVGRFGVMLRADHAHIVASVSPAVRTRTSDSGAIFMVEDVAAFRYEPHQPALREYAPTLRLGPASGSWKESATEYLALIADQRVITEQVRALAARLTATAQTDADRLRAIANFVQGDVTYRAIAFGPRAYIPSHPDQIIANRFGDCKDHTLMLHLLLSAVDIESHLALVSTGSDIDPAIPADDQFNHMILYLPAFDQFVDATDKDSDVLLPVPLGLATHHSLVLDPENPRLVRIADYPPGHSSIVINRRVRIENDRDAMIEEEITLSGYMTPWLRASLATVDPSDYAATLQHEIGSQLRMQVARATAVNVLRSDQPLIVRLSYRLPNIFHPVANGLTGTLPASYESTYLSAVPMTERLTPLRRYYPVDITTTLTIEIPTGMIIDPSRELSGQQSSLFGSATADAQLKGNLLTIKASASVPHGMFAADQYASWSAAAENALRLFEPQILLKKE